MDDDLKLKPTRWKPLKEGLKGASWPWTAAEDAILMRGADHGDDVVGLALRLNRTASAVRNRAYIKKVVFAKRLKWTSSEDKILENCVFKGMTNKDIAQVMNIKVLDVAKRREELQFYDVKKPEAIMPTPQPEPVHQEPELEPVSAPPAAGRRELKMWTAAEVNLLRLLAAERMSQADIAQKLGRTHWSVRKCAQKNRISIPGPSMAERRGRPHQERRLWAPEDDAVLVRMRAEGRSNLEISAALNRHKVNISQRAKQLGLPMRDPMEILKQYNALKKPEEKSVPALHVVSDQNAPAPEPAPPPAAVAPPPKAPDPVPPQGPRRALVRKEEAAIYEILRANLVQVGETNDWRYINGYSDQRILEEVFKGHERPPTLKTIESYRFDVRGPLWEPKDVRVSPVRLEALEGRIEALQGLVDRLYEKLGEAP